MRKSLLCVLLLFALLVIGAGRAAGESLASTPLADRMDDQDRPVENVSIVGETWAREGAFLVATLVVANVSQFPVIHAIVACEFTRRSGVEIVANRGTMVPLVLAPGITTVGGIEFVVSDPEAEGGKCRLLSAERMWSAPPAMSGE
jgi:hypothetical protein